MRISEVARRSGVALTTLKYYQREGLIHDGERLNDTQTAYDESHVQRARLVRALLDAGGLSISTAKKILHTLDSPETSLASTFEIAQHAMGVVGSSTAEPSADARDRVTAVCRSNGWMTTDANPGIDVAARALDGLSTVGFEPPVDYLQAYAVAAETIAHADLAALLTRKRPDLIAELMVVGTVFGDPLLAGLRRLAQQSVSNEFFPSSPSEQTPKKAETRT